VDGRQPQPGPQRGPALIFGDLADLWLYLLAPAAAGLALGLVWRRLSMMPRPLTAKLFHDPRYACTLGSDMPVAETPL
jgi:hypothetical protein